MTANTRRRYPFAAATLIVLVVSVVPALGQTRLYLLMGGGEPGGRLIQVDVDARRIVAETPVLHANTDVSGPRVTPDGQFVLWSGSEYGYWDYGEVPWKLFVSLYDLAAQRQSTPFVPDDTAIYVPVSVHPSAMRAYFQLASGGPITVAEPGGTRTLPAPPCATPAYSGQSGDGRRLSVRCGDPLNPLNVMVVDSSDGHLIGTVPGGAHTLDTAGTTVFAIDYDFSAGVTPTVYRRFDVATGALLAERIGGPIKFLSAWVFNPWTRQLYAGTDSGLLVRDADSLAPVGLIEPPHPALYPTLALDPDHPHAYVAWSGTIDNRPVLRLSLVHTETLATPGAVDLPVDNYLQGMAFAPRPPRVSGLSVAVQNHVGTLTWTITGQTIATEQLVEVGFAPGLTVTSLAVAAGATSLTVPGVPPGRYYVRVRSANGTGLGAPSNEVVVDVP